MMFNISQKQRVGEQFRHTAYPLIEATSIKEAFIKWSVETHACPKNYMAQILRCWRRFVLRDPKQHVVKIHLSKDNTVSISQAGD